MGMMVRAFAYVFIALWLYVVMTKLAEKFKLNPARSTPIVVLLSVCWGVFGELVAIMFLGYCVFKLYAWTKVTEEVA